MQKNEPAIFAGDFNNEELYQWLCKKVEAMTLLRSLHSDKASLQERLASIELTITQVTTESQLEISLTDPGPTPLQGGQES